MTPFQEFRFWARRAPGRERAGAGLAAVIVLALVAWLLVPDDGPSAELETVSGRPPAGAAEPLDTSVDTTIAAQPGTGGGPATGPSASGSRPSGASATPGEPATGASPAAGGGRCVSPPGTAPGVTAGEVRIAVALTEIIGPAANSVFGIPTPAEARADFDAVIAGINKEGGVACRKLVARYFNVNPADESQMMQACRDVADSGLFAIADTGALATRPAVLACFGQRKIPYFGGFFITETARQQFYPYLYSFYTKELLYKTTAFALRDLGFYDAAKGFRRLGFIYRDCERDAITAFRRWIREAGVPDAQVSTYSVGCPPVFANPADIQQAVLTFQREGVTHVIPGNFQGDLARFTDTAEQQGFRPKYGLPDEAILSIAEGNMAPNPDNIANALAIALGREAEHNTPGMTPTAGTQRCNAYYKAAGQPPVYEQPANAGHACDQLWMLQAALGAAPEVSATALPAGLQRTQSIDFSFPQGPNDFTGDRVTTGGQFWRLAQFMPSCDCWHVVQRDFRRGY